MDYRQLLRIMLEDTKQEDLAQELATTQATISRWLSGQEPRGSALERIRRLARARRLADDATIEQNDQVNQAGVVRASQMHSPRNTSEQTHSAQITGDVANLTVRTGIGNGGTISGAVDHESAVIDPNGSDGFWSFPEQVKAGWQQMNQTYAMPVTGDSMEPTLSNGSYVFVDTSHKFPSPPDLYAVNYGHGLMVKRIELLPEDRIRVISDNDRYSDFEFHQQEVDVYGRVVASFQWRG